MVPVIMKQGKLAPWLYIVPALMIMAVFVVYPTVNTIYLSFMDRTGTLPASADCVVGAPCWGIFENFRYAFTNQDMTTALRNNALWLILMVPATVILGFLFALLADRVRYESLAKSIIFMPMAISFVGAGVIWRFVYSYESDPTQQVGLLNSIIVALGGQPVAFLSKPATNNFALMVVGVWLWAGFCMTILSAAIKGLPGEVMEAARVDGANEWQVLWEIMVPMIFPTLVVVTTTMFINILKIFDIVFVMTGGNFGTEVIANRMFKLIVTDTGRSMAIAVILIILTIPILIFNMVRFRRQEEIKMKPLSRLSTLLNRIPLHFAIILMCFLWLVPTLGLFVSSFRSREAVRTTGWWQAFSPPQMPGQDEYNQFCSSCHGVDGKKITSRRSEFS